MFIIILTLSFCLSRGDEITFFEQSSVVANYADQPPYNIYEWTKQLHLETCAIVAIGLKYFAIFLEDAIRVENGTMKSTKYFLGVCHQSTLEEWTFCSPSLTQKRKHKCRFKLKSGKYHARVHRRFCDFGIMVNNRDCQCEPTILGDEMYKVEGFPTCYIPPLPNTLCKYNVCGLARCAVISVENTVHSVECDPHCMGGNPFCEHPIGSSSKVPIVESSWSEWENITDSDSPGDRLLATCINNATRQGDLDCLGPGTACCPPYTRNCNCSTFETNGVLKLERIMIWNAAEIPPPSHPENVRRESIDIFRLPRDTDDDLEDDDPGDEDLDEDIMLEENTDEEIKTTTEQLDQEDFSEGSKKDSNDGLDDEIGKNSTIEAHLRSGSTSHSHRDTDSLVIMMVFSVLNKCWS